MDDHILGLYWGHPVKGDFHNRIIQAATEVGKSAPWIRDLRRCKMSSMSGTMTFAS